MKQKFTVIGISDCREDFYHPEIMNIISHGKVFSGGLRHKEIISHLLPQDSTWIDIKVPLDNVFRQYEKYEDIIVIASGDPLFFGFANTIKKRLPEATLKVYPWFNSLQMLSHRLNMPYHDMRCVSLVGREWNAFYEAVIKNEKLIGVLTDKNHKPSDIARLLFDYGYDNYIMHVGELLGNKENESVITLSLKEASDKDFRMPNCLLLEQTYRREIKFGIPDSDFSILEGRPGMITKMPIRICTLSMLELYSKTVLWDIGFCTGSVSIEAKLQFPHLDIASFEIREEGRKLMHDNSRKFGALGINSYIADFTGLSDDFLNSLPQPDAVFIGGYGGKMKEVIQIISRHLKPGGVIVFNSVSEESKNRFTQCIEETGGKVCRHIRMAVDNFNPIEILQASLD